MLKYILFLGILIVTHWIAFMEGRADVMEKTAVVDIWGAAKPNGVSRAYFGKCAAGGRLCAVDEGETKDHWIPRGL